MIKIIAFDLIGVLVGEKDIELSKQEEKLERLFGPNISDEEYLKQAENIIDENIIEITKNIINKLYEVKDKELLKRLKERYKNIKIIIATNHVTYVKEYIDKNIKNVDEVIISAEIHKIKPNSDFYEYILNKYNLKPSELLFLDDNIDNVVGATKLGIKTIKVNKDTNIYDEIGKEINN